MDFVAREGVAPSGDTSSLHSRTAGEPSHVDRLHPRRHHLNDRPSRAIVPVISQVVLGHPVLLTPYDPNGISTDYSQAPSLKHFLGTDKLGLDIFSRVLAALPLDLAIGVGIAGFALLLGGGLGLVAGYWDKPRTLGGVISAVILRVTDVFLAFPSLVLALAIAASLGRGTGPSILAVLLTWWPYYVRLTRGEVLAVTLRPYV